MEIFDAYHLKNPNGKIAALRIAKGYFDKTI
jgi:hypothetical protein